MNSHASSVGTTVALLAALVFGGCVAPTPIAAGVGSRLYVLNGLDGTITPLDGQSGRVVGAPMPAGPAPAQLAPGPEGSVIALSFFSRLDPGQLMHVTPATSQARGPRVLASGLPLRQALVGGDGRRFAVVVTHDPIPSTDADGSPAPRCHLALINVPAGTVNRKYPVCGAGEMVMGLAVEPIARESGGVVVYLSVMNLRSSATRNSSRLVSIDTESGAVLAALPLSGPAEHLVLAPGPNRVGNRLYAVEPIPGAENDYTITGHWRLLVLDPATLDVECWHDIHISLRSLALSPEGGHAYAIAAGGDDILHFDLDRKLTEHLGKTPRPGMGLAVTEKHLYVPDPTGDSVWQLHRRDGSLIKSIVTGRRPVAIYVFPAT